MCQNSPKTTKPTGVAFDILFNRCQWLVPTHFSTQFSRTNQSSFWLADLIDQFERAVFELYILFKIPFWRLCLEEVSPRVNKIDVLLSAPETFYRCPVESCDFRDSQLKTVDEHLLSNHIKSYIVFHTSLSSKSLSQKCHKCTFFIFSIDSHRSGSDKKKLDLSPELVPI